MVYTRIGTFLFNNVVYKLTFPQGPPPLPTSRGRPVLGVCGCDLSLPDPLLTPCYRRHTPLQGPPTAQGQGQGAGRRGRCHNQISLPYRRPSLSEVNVSNIGCVCYNAGKYKLEIILFQNSINYILFRNYYFMYFF